MKEFRYLIQETKRYVPPLLIGSLCTLLISVSSFLVPLISSRLIDEVLAIHSLENIIPTMSLFVIVCISQPVIEYVQNAVMLTCTEKIVRNLRDKLFLKTLARHSCCSSSASDMELTTLIINDVRMFSSFLNLLATTFVRCVLLLILVMVGMCIQSLSISIILLCLMGLYLSLNHLMSKKFQSISQGNLKTYDQLCSAIKQAEESVIPIRVYRLSQKVISNFSNLTEQSFKLNMSSQLRSAALGSLSGAVMVISLAVVYVLGAIQVVQGYMSVGSVVALGLYFQMISDPVKSLTSIDVLLKQSKPAFKRLYEYLTADDPIIQNYSVNDDKSNALDIHNAQPGFECANIKPYTYRFDYPGCYLLKGASGSGKTTLLRLLANEEPLCSGQICVGQELGRNFKVAYEEQKVQFVASYSYWLNIVGTDEPTEFQKERIHAYIKKLGLDTWLNQQPEGLATVVPEDYTSSGGETKRLALIRALNSDARILLLDEIDAGLDSLHASEMKDLIREESKNKLIIIATHSHIFDSIAHDIYMLD